MRQELGKTADWMGGQAREDIRKPSKRIDSDPLARCHETPEHGSSHAAVVAVEKDLVVAPDGQTTDRALGSIVVDLEISVFAVAV